VSRRGTPVAAAVPLSPRRRAALALALWLLAMLAGALVIARTPFETDLSAFLPSSPDPGQRLLIEQLQSGVAARTLLIGIEGGDSAARSAASRELAAALRASGRFEQVQNGERGSDEPAAGRSGAGAERVGAANGAAGSWQATGQWLVDRRYLLSPAVTPARFSVEGLRDAIDETLSLLGTPAGALAKPLLERDPTGETRRVAEVLVPTNAPRSESGVWVSREAPRALLIAITRAAGDDLDAQATALQAVHEAFDAPKAQQAQLRLLLSGPAVFSVQSRALIEREVKELALAGLIAVGGLLLLAFASLRALAVALLPVATGIVAGVAAVSLAFGSVHGFTLAFGSTLIGEAVDYAIYYLIQARGGASAVGARGEGWRRWLTGNWPTVRLGLLTSVCGFGVLVFSGFPGLAQLGVFSVAGLCGAAFATRWVLPAVVPEGAGGQGLRRHMSRLAALALRALPRARGSLIVLGVCAAGVLVVQGLSQGDLWRGDLGSLSPVPRSAQELDERLRADLGASDAGTLVVANGADMQAALRAAEAAGTRLDELVEQGLLAGYETPARLLPSLDTQRARQASLPDADVLQERLQAATQGGPLPARRLQAFVTEVQAARSQPLLDRAALQASPLAPAVDALLFERATGGWSALIALQPGAAGMDASRVRAALAGLAPAHDIQGIAIAQELRALYDRYLREALAQALIGALAVVAVLALHLRSPRRLLAVCQPLALAVLLTLGGLSLAGVALGILHLVGLLLVVAVGSNYALFFDQLLSRREAAEPANDDTLASLLLANLTTVVSFGLIALSDISALSAIGRVVAPGALLALLLAAAFARGRPQSAALHAGADRG
jgi:predicted exporter